MDVRPHYKIALNEVDYILDGLEEAEINKIPKKVQKWQKIKKVSVWSKILYIVKKILCKNK